MFDKLFWGAFALIAVAVMVALLQNRYKENPDRYISNQHQSYQKRDLQKVDKKDLQYKSANLYERLSLLNANLGDRVFIRIFKEQKILEVWIKPKSSRVYKILKTYDICNYSGNLGPKLKEGDYQAPEGFYKVYKGSLNPNSRFHLSFNLGFPNRYDKAHNRTGSYLMVHGECASIGCYAMGNKNIEEIYELIESALDNNQSFVNVHIFPSRLTKEWLDSHRSSRWYSFWQNLKEGYDIFEKSHIPPTPKVANRRYIF
jgi:murein L,D-transpeptidase YafK